MLRHGNRLVFLSLLLLVLAVTWSCSQPDDVLTGTSSTKVSLVAERLPSLPEGLSYELWVANDSDTTSLGKFYYNFEEVKYYEIDRTTEMANEFILNGDLDNYTNMFISVESMPDDNTLVPGSIMLIDVISEDPIFMVFPDSDTLWRATVRYNMEGVSDNNRYAGDGQGVWFTSYTVSNKSIPDTIGLEWKIDSSYLGTLELAYSVDPGTGDTIVDTTNKDSLFELDEFGNVLAVPVIYDSEWADTTVITFGDDTLLLNIDSFTHIGYRYHIDSAIPPGPAYYKRNMRKKFEYETVAKDVDLDLFTQDEFALPDYTKWGWKYKGWVVSDNINPNIIDSRLTPPAWRYQSNNLDYIPGAEGGLLTTGTFTFVDQADDGNPFVVDPTKVPDYPGEDFLNLAALQDSFPLITHPAEIDLMTYATGNQGTVFITLEPINFSSRTNFPLFAFVKAMPENRDEISDNFVQINMKNWTMSLSGDLYGFPRVSVKIEEF